MIVANYTKFNLSRLNTFFNDDFAVELECFRKCSKQLFTIICLADSDT